MTAETLYVVTCERDDTSRVTYGPFHESEIGEAVHFCRATDGTGSCLSDHVVAVLIPDARPTGRRSNGDAWRPPDRSG